MKWVRNQSKCPIMLGSFHRSDKLQLLLLSLSLALSLSLYRYVYICLCVCVCTCTSIPIYVHINIYVYIRCVCLTPSHFCGEHSCWGLWVEGLVPYRISAHQLRNGVQIAALIPRLSLAGRSSAPSQPISNAGPSFDGLGGDSSRVSLTTLQHTVYLVCVCVCWGVGGRGVNKKWLLTMDSFGQNLGSYR